MLNYDEKLPTTLMPRQADRRDWINIAIILALNVLPRLVYILDKGFFIDGDEAIFGCMVKNFVQTGHLSLFFSGQNYGFVFFEVLISGLISFIFGTNIIALKMAMLLFWLGSMIVLYFISKKIMASRQWALVAVLLVSFIPVWFDWASKARGGYPTALLLSLIIIFLVFCRKTVGRILTIGLSLIFIYYSQPLWLVIVLPFIAYYFLKHYSTRNTLVFIGSLLLGYGCLGIAFKIIGFHYQAQNKLGFDRIGTNLQNLLYNLHIAYSGQFFDAAAFKADLILAINSSIFIGLLFGAIAYNLYLSVIKKIKASSFLFMSATVLYLVFMLFYNDSEFSYRYFLPLFLPGMILIVLTVKNLPSPSWRYYSKIFLAVYAFFSLLCGICFFNNIFAQDRGRDAYSEVERIEFLKEYLAKEQVACVYTMDWIISQHLHYFADDLVNRSKDFDPRRPADDILTDRLFQQGNSCALVGLWYQMPEFTRFYSLQDIVVVGGRYVIYLNPRRDELLKLGFRLSE